MVVDTVWCGEHVGRDARRVFDWVWDVWVDDRLAGINCLWWSAPGGEFSITKPTRETLFTVVPREEKYQAKNVIDMVVHRGADMTGTEIVSVFHTGGMILSHMAFAAMPIAGDVACCGDLAWTAA